MKMRLTFKDPDVLIDELESQKFEMKKTIIKDLNISEEAAEVEVDFRMKKMEQLVDKYMEYSEYITVEFDDETDTARVVPNNE